MNTRTDNTLEKLSVTQRSYILEMAANARLADVVLSLKQNGIETSAASLSRFVRRDRESRLLDDRAESQAAVEALAEHGKNGALREGTMEAVRQRLYERALFSQSGEEARELFAELVKEEAKLKEMELEARKVAALEEQVQLQRLRIELERSKIRVKGEVVPNEDCKTQNANCVEGEKAPRELAPSAGTDAPSAGVESEREKKLTAVISEVPGIVNRGGPVEERLLEAREAVAGIVKKE